MANGSIEDLLKAENESSGNARATWMVFILLGAYLAVTVGATTYEQLLLGATIELPLLGVRLPLKAFYQVVPGLFVLMHFYTMVQLYLLSRTLHLLNAEIENSGILRSERGQLRTRVDSFIISQLISGQTQDWLPRHFVRFATWITLLAAPVVLLLAFQLQFLAYHDILTTWIDRITLIVDLILIWLLWPAILHPSGRFGGAVFALIRWLAVQLWYTPRQILAAIRFARVNVWRIPSLQELWEYIWEYISAYRALRDSFGVVCERMLGLVALVAICGGAVLFSLFVATIPGEEIETLLVRNTDDLPSSSLPPSCKSQGDQYGTQSQQPAVAGGSAPTASTASASFIAWIWDRATGNSVSRLLACLFEPKTWTHRTAQMTPLSPDPIHPWPGQAWWPTAILFEGAFDPVRSGVKSWFARNIVLIDANLIGADSEKLDKVQRTIVLRGRDLRNAVLDGADLRKADLTGARLGGASLLRTRLSSANLADADLAKAKLEYTELQNAHLERTRLKGVNLGHAQLQGANLTDAQLQDADLTSAQLDGAILDRAQLQGAYLNFAALTGAHLFFAHLQGAELVLARLEGAKLNSAKLEGAVLELANLEGASLDQAQLQGADLHAAALQAAQLIFAHLEGTDLSSARLEGADLSSADLDGADLRDAQLQAASLRSAHLWRALAPEQADNFKLTDLRGIDSSALNQRALEGSIFQWVSSVPPGPRRENAQKRLSRLTSALRSDEDEALAAPWKKTAARGWDEARDDPSLADFLAKLGCTAEFAPYLARGLLSRVHREFFIEGFDTHLIRAYITRLAAYLLASKCAGAKGLSEEERTLSCPCSQDAGIDFLWLASKRWNDPRAGQEAWP